MQTEEGKFYVPVVVSQFERRFSKRHLLLGEFDKEKGLIFRGSVGR